MNTYIETLRSWLARKALRAVSRIDYSIRAGDFVTHNRWKHTSLKVVSVNWALLAIAVQLGPDGGVVVWPAWGLKKVAK